MDVETTEKRGWSGFLVGDGGYADYAERHGSQYRRIEALAEVDGQLRVLDLKREHIRQAIRQAGEAKMLYASDLAHDYQ